jgi:diguanylate cyclase (GGDEF)-like protein/PAS domain S-box-containing protein
LEGRLLGFISFETYLTERIWNNDAILLLRTVGDIIAAGLARRDAQAAIAQTQHWYETLVNNHSDGLVVIDGNARLKYASPVAEAIFNRSSGGLIDTDMLQLVHPDDVELARSWLDDVARHPGRQPVAEVCARRADNSWFTCEVAANSMLDDPSIEGIVITVRDATARLADEEALRISEQRLRTLIDNIPGAVTRCEAYPPWQTIYISDAIYEITGYEARAFINGDLVYEDLIVNEDRERTDLEVTRAIEAHQPFATEYQLQHRDGTIRWVAENGQTSFDADDNPQWIDGAIFDITERKALEHQLSYDAGHDPLTQLLNRPSLLDALAGALAETMRRGTKVAVLYLDLDRFKLVNDALGHAAGDDLLVAFAHRLNGVLRVGDVAARPGGDEFVALCRNLESPDEAIAIAERIIEALDAPFTIRGKEVFAKASIGIAIADAPIDGESLLRNADLAAYRAKERGRNRYELFDEALRLATKARLDTETQLHRAVESGELELYYQPVVNLHTDMVIGFEALARWNHPERGQLSPGDFLPAAEASGLIVPIGHHLLELACEQLKHWSDTAAHGRRPTLAVNLSARQLAQPDLAPRVAAIIADARIDPTLLCIEITESVLMDEAANNVDMLQRLKAIGVRIAIDDFGTGYSSLSYLRHFAVDLLKVDRSFVAELGRDESGSTIVRAIASLGHALGLELVAEGVETEEQARLLLALGCDQAQGYLYNRPLPVDLATALLERESASRADPPAPASA